MNATEMHAEVMQCASILLEVMTVAARMAFSAIRSLDVSKYRWDHALILLLVFAVTLHRVPSIISVSIISA